MGYHDYWQEKWAEQDRKLGEAVRKALKERSSDDDDSAAAQSSSNTQRLADNPNYYGI